MGPDSIKTPLRSQYNRGQSLDVDREPSCIVNILFTVGELGKRTRGKRIACR